MIGKLTEINAVRIYLARINAEARSLRTAVQRIDAGRWWSDGQWRKCEPDGYLPLYNAHRLKNAAVLFLHEGAKSARHVQRLVDGELRADRAALADHPWGAELSCALHLGWIGGAMSPER